MKKVLALFLAVLIVLSFAACGGKKNNNGGNNETVNSSNDVNTNNVDDSAAIEDVDSLTFVSDKTNITKSLFLDEKVANKAFDSVTPSIDPEEAGKNVPLSFDVLSGIYTLYNSDKNIKKVTKSVGYQTITWSKKEYTVSTLPVSIRFGADSLGLILGWSGMDKMKNAVPAELVFATEDGTKTFPAVYEVNGNKVTFTLIENGNETEDDFTYDLSDTQFSYNIRFNGANLIVTGSGSAITLVPDCFDSDNMKFAISGYLVPGSPSAEKIDSISTLMGASVTLRDGKYMLVGIKQDTSGRVIIIFFDKENPENYTVHEYMAIYHCPYIRVSCTVTLYDGEKVYDYSDGYSDREARNLDELGMDIEEVSNDTLKAVAQKKEEIFSALAKEFEAEGISVTINRENGEIALDNSVIFGGDSAALSAEGKEMLDKFVAVYTKVISTDDYKDFIEKTIIEGNTAPVAGDSYEDGLPLSVERANAVAEYCISLGAGLTDANVSAVGKSNVNPIYDDEGNVDMNASRRVSFCFTVNFSAI